MQLEINICIFFYILAHKNMKIQLKQLKNLIFIFLWFIIKAKYNAKYNLKINCKGGACMGMLGDNGPMLTKRSNRSNKDETNLDALDVFMNSAPKHWEPEVKEAKEIKLPTTAPSTNDGNRDPEQMDEYSKTFEDINVQQDNITPEKVAATDDVEYIDDSSIEVFDTSNVDEETGEILRGLNVDSVVPDDMEFGSNAVARALGVTTQSIRNYCNTYAKFLDIETTKNGTRRYRMKDIRKLHKIISVKSDRGYTTQQMLSFLENEGKEELLVTDAERMNALADTVADKVFDRLCEYMKTSGILEQFTEKEKKLLLQQTEMFESMGNLEKKHADIVRINEEMDRKLDDLRQKEESLSSLFKDFSAQKDLAMEKDQRHLDELQKQMEETMKKSEELLKEKEQYIHELEETVEKMQKKKRFFFRK